MIPLVPVLAGLVTFAGGATLLWYDALSRDDRHRVNKRAADYAAEMFGKTVEQLTGRRPGPSAPGSRPG